MESNHTVKSNRWNIFMQTSFKCWIVSSKYSLYRDRKICHLNFVYTNTLNKTATYWAYEHRTKFSTHVAEKNTFLLNIICSYLLVQARDLLAQKNITSLYNLITLNLVLILHVNIFERCKIYWIGKCFCVSLCMWNTT